jgi:hypothetical protein
MPVFQKPLFLPKAVSAAFVAGRRSMSATAKVWVNKDTRVICQGFTGKQVRIVPWDGTGTGRDCGNESNFLVLSSPSSSSYHFREPFIPNKRLIMERKWWVE